LHIETKKQVKKIRQYKISTYEASKLRSTGQLEKQLAYAGFNLKEPISERIYKPHNCIVYEQIYLEEEAAHYIKNKVNPAYKNAEFDIKFGLIKKQQQRIANEERKLKESEVEQEKKPEPELEIKPLVNNLLLFKDVIIDT